MSGQKTRDKEYNADYVIGLIDGENALTTNLNDYPFRYGIPENAIGLEYLERAEKGDLVLGYKTIKYRVNKEGVEWKDLPRIPCKNNGIFAVYEVERGYEYNEDWSYPHTICLRKPFVLLKTRIEFKDLKTLVPKSEYVENCRRSVTRFSKTEAKKIFEMMRNKNPEIAEKINKILNELS